MKQRTRVVVRGAGFVWGFVLALPLAAALIVFVAQNTGQVTVRWTVWKVSTSLAAVVLVTIFVAVVLAELIGIVWRGRRRRIAARQEALQAELAERAPSAEALEPSDGGELDVPASGASEETGPTESS